MIANWPDGCLILSPESNDDQQVLIALSEACPIMRWTSAPREDPMDHPIEPPQKVDAVVDGVRFTATYRPFNAVWGGAPQRPGNWVVSAPGLDGDVMRPLAKDDTEDRVRADLVMLRNQHPSGTAGSQRNKAIPVGSGP